MPNAENLVPNNKRTPSQRRKNASKAGKASGEARRAKRDAKETALIFLNMAATGNLDDILGKLDVSENDRTNLMGIIARQVVTAQGGGPQSEKAARLVLELAGMLQKGGIENNINISTDEEKVVFYLPENGRD